MRAGVEPKRTPNRDQLYFRTLPYDHQALSCGHSPLYVVQPEDESPKQCGLCLFKDGYDSETPTRIHLFKTLAENGNPETNPKFFSHLFLVQGLLPPRVDSEGNPEPLHEFRRRRGQLHCNDDCPTICHKHRPRERDHYTEPAWRLFPVASALWKLMGFQPPLAVVLVRGVNGFTETQIAAQLDTSLQNINIRMAKAIRTAVGYLPRVQATREPDGAVA